MIRFVKSFIDSLSVKRDKAILVCLRFNIPLTKDNIDQIEMVLNSKKQLKRTVKELKFNTNHKAQC